MRARIARKTGYPGDIVGAGILPVSSENSKDNTDGC
jgi:hypothetical protein